MLYIKIDLFVSSFFKKIFVILLYKDTSYHIVGSFTRMPEWHVLWHYSVEHHFHVVSYVWIPIFING